jgi:pimeloyl-ACP methyl ester carboxylesterase
MIEAFFFGTGKDQLFATYHPPAGGSARGLTVICPPLFAEYMRTQLVLRELAITLAGKGQHVLRFDYRGTGDSFGELAEVAISDWLEDILLAVREGCDLSGSNIVQLVGVRAGALLACKAAGVSGDVQRVVLWDPVPDGAEYLEILRRIRLGILERNSYLSRVERHEAMREYGGHRLTERMLEEFRLLDARAYSSVPKHKLHVVSTSPADGFPVHDVSRELAPFACNWETDLEAQIRPQPVLERLTACLTMS